MLQKKKNNQINKTSNNSSQKNSHVEPHSVLIVCKEMAFNVTNIL